MEEIELNAAVDKIEEKWHCKLEDLPNEEFKEAQNSSAVNQYWKENSVSYEDNPLLRKTLDRLSPRCHRPVGLRILWYLYKKAIKG